MATAAQLTQKNMKRPKTTSVAGDWQNEGWYFYDTCGEFRFGVNWKAQALSRCELYIEEEVGPDEWKRNDNCPEAEVLEAIVGSDHSEMLSTFGLHMEVPGETYLLGELLDQDGNPDPNGTEQWTLYSNEELKPRGTDTGQYTLEVGDGKPRVIDTTLAVNAPVVFRIWKAHPRRRLEADSPTRASLPILREIENLSRKIAAEIDSRLAGAGVLFVPTEMTFSGAATTPTAGVTRVEGDPDAPEEPTAGDPQQDANKFLLDLMESMITPLGNRDHPSSVVPVIVKAPGQWLDKVKHVAFSTPLDERTLDLRTEDFKRLATSADIPAEILLGVGDVNHWSAWQLEESAIKVHVDPLGGVFASALTQVIVPWGMRQMGQKMDPKRRVQLDTGDLRLRPDRSAQAQWLYEHFELAGDDLRRELGVEGDAPTGEELALMVARDLVERGMTTPDVVLAAARRLGVEFHVIPEAPDTRQPLPADNPESPNYPGGKPVKPQPGEGVPPEKSPPADTGPPEPSAPPAQAASGHTPAEVAVMACAELLVKRAVEKANNRVNRRARVRTPIPTDRLDAALQGAWDDVADTAGHLGLDPEWFTDRLDRYARGVLTTGAEHSREVLAKVLGS